MNVLVLNAGSSTLKFQLVRTDADRMAADRDEKIARGSIERIGGEAVYSVRAGAGNVDRGIPGPTFSHRFRAGRHASGARATR